MGVQGKGERGRAVPPDPRSRSHPRSGLPTGTGAAGLALAADNAVPMLAAPDQRGGGGQTRSHPECAVLGGHREGVLASAGAAYFYTSCFLSGMTPSRAAAGAGPGPPRLISLPIKQQSGGRSGAPGWGGRSPGQGARCSAVPLCARPHRPPLDRHPLAVLLPSCPAQGLDLGVSEPGLCVPTGAGMEGITQV